MKNTLIGTIIVSLLVIASCTKSTPATDGTWTFKSVVYDATSIATSHNSVTVNDQVSQTSTNFQSLGVSFFYSGLPTSGGTFVVRPGVYIDSTDQVCISLTNYTSADTTYQATGGNGAQTVQVTVSSSGQLSISGSGIEMVNTANPSDSAPLTFNIKQPQ